MKQEKPRQAQVQTQPKKTRVSKDLVQQYVGKQVVIELEEVDENACSGCLAQYDGRFVKIKDYKKHQTNIPNAIKYSDLLDHNLTSPQSVSSSLRSKTINVNLIAPIQTLDDVLDRCKSRQTTK